jgi:plasmid replication initiation protein
MKGKSKINKGIKLIKKSNELIEARYKFDIWETRIFTSVLGQIAREDEDFQVYRIYLRDIIKEFGINNGNAYDLLRVAADSLMNKKFFLDYEGDGADRKKVHHIIRSVDYMTRLKEEAKRGLNEYIDVSIDPDMKPFLLQLKEQFTTYDVRNIIKFKSSYTVRIYEHLKQYESIGRRKLEVDYLKKAFEINDEYPLFANFYQKVIEPAFRDINEYTDLSITSIEKLKEGKKVTALLFEFHRKSSHDFNKTKKLTKPLTLPLLAESATDEVLSPQLEVSNIDNLFVQYQQKVVSEYGVAPTIFIGALEGKTIEQVEQAIRVTDEAKKKSELVNVAGFFIEALRKGFTNQKEEKSKTAKQRAETKRKEEELLRLEQERQSFSINEKIRELTLANPKITEEAVQTVMASKAGQFRMKTMGLKSPTIDDFRNDYILREFVKNAIIEAYSAEFENI